MIAFAKVFVLRNDQKAQELWAFLKLHWRTLAEAGRPLEIIVCPWQAKRTLAQNRKYWVLLKQLAESAWVDGKRYSDETWHEFFKRQFIGLQELPFGGTAGISTTSLSVSEFADYLTQVMAYAAREFGIELQ